MTRSLLFVPGDSERKIEKALAGDADALILDLEDSVAPERKPLARGIVARVLGENRSGKHLWVRVNALDSGLLLQDLAAVVALKPYGIVLPKCQGRATLEPVHCYLDALETAAGMASGSVKILAIATETARSLFGLGDYAGISPRLWGLTWGAEDLAADVGSLSNQGGDGGGYSDPYRLVRSLCLFAAAAAGVRCIDAVCVRLDDDELLQKEASEAFRDGFSGKMAIHPQQLPTLHKAFAPSPEQILWARRVVDAFAATPGAGALRLDGQMIDKPHLRLAQRFLETSKAS